MTKSISGTATPKSPPGCALNAAGSKSAKKKAAPATSSGSARSSKPEITITVHCRYDRLEAPAKLKPHPRNPRIHPAEQIQSLAEIIKTTGWRRPVTISKRSGCIVHGHGAVEAAKLLGCPVPIEVQPFCDAAEEHAHMIADNRLAELSAWNDAVLAGLLKELEAETALETSGFDGTEMEQMLAQLNLQVEPVTADTQSRLDQKTPVECPKCHHRFTP